MKSFLKISIIFCTLLLLPQIIEAKSVNAKPIYTSLKIDSLSYKVSAYKINGSNYYSIYDLQELLHDTKSRFKITKDSKSKAIILSNSVADFIEFDNTFADQNDPALNAQAIKKKIIRNGKTFTIHTYTINSSNNVHVKLTDAAKILNFKLSEDKKTNTATVQTTPVKEIITRHKLTENNYTHQMPSFGRFGGSPGGYLYVNPDKTYTAVHVNSNNIVVTKYSKTFKKLSTKNLKRELTQFGTFYAGKKYNYIAFGKPNKEQYDTEVIRIVKYDKNFKRLGATIIKGETIKTTIPFNGSSGGQMVEVNNTLIYHTSRERYKDSDGLNHQSQLTIQIDSKNMKLLSASSLFPWNHVSHSFNQFVVADESSIAYLDHGDGYPRSIVLHQESNSHSLSDQGNYDMEEYYEKARQEIAHMKSEGAKIEDIRLNGYEDQSFTEEEMVKVLAEIIRKAEVSEVIPSISKNNIELFKIEGVIGRNETGVTVSGFSQSSSNYFVAFNSIKQSSKYDYGHFKIIGLADADKRTNYVYIVPKNFGQSETPKITKLTLADYTKSNNYGTKPTLVKLNNNRFIALWQEFNSKKIKSKLRYVLIDGSGKVIKKASLSDFYYHSSVQPIVVDKKVIWFTDYQKTRTFYELIIAD